MGYLQFVYTYAKYKSANPEYTIYNMESFTCKNVIGVTSGVMWKGVVILLDFVDVVLFKI